MLVKELWQGRSARSVPGGGGADKGVTRSVGHLALTRWVRVQARRVRGVGGGWVGGGWGVGEGEGGAVQRHQGWGRLGTWAPPHLSRPSTTTTPTHLQDARLPATVDNLVLLTHEEADAHDQLAGGKGGRCSHACWVCCAVPQEEAGGGRPRTRPRRPPPKYTNTLSPTAQVPCQRFKWQSQSCVPGWRRCWRERGATFFGAPPTRASRCPVAAAAAAAARR